MVKQNNIPETGTIYVGYRKLGEEITDAVSDRQRCQTVLQRYQTAWCNRPSRFLHNTPDSRLRVSLTGALPGRSSPDRQRQTDRQTDGRTDRQTA
eukprot:7861514-Heterocapsa_arctica.AAC.1